GAILMQRGKIKNKGVLPPEACVDPMDFLQLMREVLSIDDSDETKKSPVIFESIDENGNVKKMEF
ncbi:MAG: saccharopine dehydrogenase, partial [Candidatus Hodarchaeota archaeon]